MQSAFHQVMRFIQHGVGRAVAVHEIRQAKWPDEGGIGVQAQVVVGKAQLPEGELDDLLVGVPRPQATDRLADQVAADEDQARAHPFAKCFGAAIGSLVNLPAKAQAQVQGAK